MKGTRNTKLKKKNHHPKNQIYHLMIMLRYGRNGRVLWNNCHIRWAEAKTKWKIFLRTSRKYPQHQGLNFLFQESW